MTNSFPSYHHNENSNNNKPQAFGGDSLTRDKELSCR